MIEKPIQVVALGSPHGDDRAGWEVASRIQLDSAQATRVQIHTATSTWDVVERCRSANRLLIIDACQSASSPGTLHRWSPHELPAITRPRHSSHRGSLQDALQLAKQLGAWPQELLILGIELRSAEPGQSICGEVDKAIDRAVELVSKWLEIP